ncbi:MAG: hypothetical protein RR806_08680, partial [Oscillospiraceae bacterium]
IQICYPLRCRQKCIVAEQFKVNNQTNRAFYLAKTFNDRIIRSEQGYHEVWQYIDENPLGQNGGR